MQDGTAGPVSRDQTLRHVRGQGNIHFPCSADHEQDWQPYPVDPYSAICDEHTYCNVGAPESRVYVPFPCSADHEQDWKPYLVYPSLAISDDHSYYTSVYHTSYTDTVYTTAQRTLNTGALSPL